MHENRRSGRIFGAGGLFISTSTDHRRMPPLTKPASSDWSLIVS